MYDTDVHPDARILTPSDGDGRLLDTEADVPAERILEQPATGDSTLAGCSGDRQGARPSESDSPDQEDRDLAPAAIHLDDSKVGRLREVNRHTSGPTLEPAASSTPTMPLVEEVPDSARRVPLLLQLLQLGRSG
jgi:hypothetical protein